MSRRPLPKWSRRKPLPVDVWDGRLSAAWDQYDAACAMRERVGAHGRWAWHVGNVAVRVAGWAVDFAGNRLCDAGVAYEAEQGRAW